MEPLFFQSGFYSPAKTLRGAQINVTLSVLRHLDQNKAAVNCKMKIKKIKVIKLQEYLSIILQLITPSSFLSSSEGRVTAGPLSKVLILEEPPWNQQLSGVYPSAQYYIIIYVCVCVCVCWQDLSPGSVEEAEEAEPDDEFKDAIEVKLLLCWKLFHCFFFPCKSYFFWKNLWLIVAPL